jgi:hypothetical protein
MIAKPKTKRQTFEAAKSKYDHCSRMLRAHEILWRDIWESQPNPFLRIKQHRQKKQVDMRMAIITPWIDAKREYVAASKAFRTSNDK